MQNGVTVIDDFAHHPSAIEATIAALRGKVGRDARILAVFEPRSNTMKLGTMKDRLAASLKDADRVFCYKGKGVNWDPAGALLPLGGKASTFRVRLTPWPSWSQATPNPAIPSFA